MKPRRAERAFDNDVTGAQGERAADASVRPDLDYSEREISWSVGIRPFGVR